MRPMQGTVAKGVLVGLLQICSVNSRIKDTGLGVGLSELGRMCNSIIVEFIHFEPLEFILQESNNSFHKNMNSDEKVTRYTRFQIVVGCSL